MIITECVHCEDSEGFPIELEIEGGVLFCPVCGEEYDVYI